MVNLVIPVAGAGRRFVEAGYTMPKQLITVGHKTNIEWSMDCIYPDTFEKIRKIFIMRKDQQLNHSLDNVLKDMFGECEIVTVPALTGGAVETVLAASDLIDNLDPLVIYTPDTYFEPKFCVSSKLFEDCGGHILTFKANSPNYSYVESDDRGQVIQTQEKQVISPNAAVGVYGFAKGSDFVTAAQVMITQDIRTKGEFYICPLYNILIAQGRKVTTSSVEKLHVFGTPEEMDFFVKASLRTFPEYKTNIALCADHSGYELKEQAKQILAEWELPFTDFGTFSPRDCDYTAFVKAAGNAVLNGLCSFGMGFCRTGQGINMTANKILGIRGALVFDDYTAEHAIRHNCANFFSVSSKYTEDLLGVLRAWKSNTFDGGRHQNRIQGLE
jgi:RpiB/LacA/LacB family sugar-phosphate isomerase